jgi:hypothetical protein
VSLSSQTRPAIAAFLLALALLVTAAATRGMEYDEGYTIFLAAGDPRPTWPAEIFTAGSVRKDFVGQSSAAGIAAALRQGDVHPPLYFWAVAASRALIGTSLVATRALSVLCAVAALALTGTLAYGTGTPPALAMLLLGLSYGFVYTGAVARGFAMALLLLLAGSALVWRASTRGSVGSAAIAGLAFGAAAFTNYLAAFGGAAALFWLLLRHPRRPLWLAGGLAMALFLPAGGWFFLAQKDSRSGQFEPFHLLPALARLARSAGGAIFGGLPLYLPPPANLRAGAALGVLLVALAGLILVRGRRRTQPGGFSLLMLMAAATPAGLIALGLIFNNTPIELRYLAFSLPFIAILLAGALAGGPAWLAAPTLAVQALAIAGLLLRPETMQPQARTAALAAATVGRGGLVLLPFGNDGVGVPGAFIASAPDWLRIRLVRRDDSAASLTAAAAGSRRVALAMLGLDADSRRTLPLMRAAFPVACWRTPAESATLLVLDRDCEKDPRCCSTVSR